MAFEEASNQRLQRGCNLRSSAAQSRGLKELRDFRTAITDLMQIFKKHTRRGKITSIVSGLGL